MQVEHAVPWERAGAPGHAGAVRLAGWMALGRSLCLSGLHSLGSIRTSDPLSDRWLHIPELLACVTLSAPGRGVGSCLRPLTAGWARSSVRGRQVSSAAGFCPARRSRRPPCLADPSPDLGDLSAVVKRGLPHPECRGPSADSTPRYCGTFGSQLGYSCGCEGSQAVAPPWTVLGSVR